MENKINLVELLKDCPKGMELDCTVFGTKVIYQKIYKTAPYPIVVQTEHGFEFRLTQYGQIHNIVGAECVIFPKGKTTWEGFVPPCKFKVGDRIRTKKDAPINMSNILITKVNECSYEGVIGYTTNHAHISFKYQDLYELVPNKFDINTLVPFESKVLVRNVDGGSWKPAIYGFSPSNGGCYVVGGVYWKQCIPYEGNEHLRGKTDDCDDFYKNWE